MDPSRRQRTQTKATAEEQALDRIARECMFVKFERANVTYLNDDYMYNTTVFVRRYSRKSPYCLHIIANTRHLWNNNVTVELIFNQFLHNEYRRSFIEMHYKFCDFIRDEPYAGGMLKLIGLVCPMKAIKAKSYYNVKLRKMGEVKCIPFGKRRRICQDQGIKIRGSASIILKGFIALTNMTAPTQNFPNVFPFEKGRVDTSLVVTATKELIFSFYVEASFKQ